MAIELKSIYLGMGDLFVEKLIPAIDISPDRNLFTDNSYGMLLYWSNQIPWIKIEAKTNNERWIKATLNSHGFQKNLAQMGASNSILDMQKLLDENFCLAAITNRSNPVNLQFTISSSTREIKQFAIQYRKKYPDATNVPLTIYFKAFDFRQGPRTNTFKINLSFSPLISLHPYEGYVSIDLGNFSTGICSLFGAKVKGGDILSLSSDQLHPKLTPEIDTIVSQVRIDAVNTWFDSEQEAKEAPNRTYPDSDKSHDRLSPSSEWVIGTTAEDGNKCRQVAGPKRLMAKMDANQTISLILDHQKHFYNDNLKDWSVNPVSETINIGNKLPAELLIGRMFEKFGQAVPVGGEKPAGWPKYLAVTYPTSYSPMEIHALRKTIYGAWLRTYLQSIVGTDQNNPVDQAQKNIAEKIEARLSNPKLQNYADKDDPLIRLMIDEATAASFFFLFKFAVDSPGGLRAFHYLYPEGMNLLLYDCGGGTTDIALVKAKVDSKTLNQVTIEVLGRSGVRHFGGDDITWMVCKLLKAKIAALSLRRKTENFDNPININEPKMVQFENGNRYVNSNDLIANGKAIQMFFDSVENQSGNYDFVPTTFNPQDFTELTQTSRDNAYILWSWGEKIKHRLGSRPPSGDPVEFIALEAIAGVSFNRDTGSLHKAILESVNGSYTSRDADFVEQLGQIRIYRAEIDAMIARSVVRTIACCKNLIEQKFPGERGANAPVVVHKIAVTGKASIHLMISEMIKERLKISDLDPKAWFHFDQKELKSAVAKGAVQALAATRGHAVAKFHFDTRMSECLPFDVAYWSIQENDYKPLYKHQTKYQELVEKTIPLIGTDAVSQTLFKRFPGDGDQLEFKDQGLIDFDPSGEITKLMANKGYSELITWQFNGPISESVTVWYDPISHTFEAKDKNGVRGKPQPPDTIDPRERAPRQRGTL